MSNVNILVIIANGTVKDKKFHRNILNKADKIICADGGANHCMDIGIIPDYVIGDMDSIKKTLLKKLQKNKKTKCIIDKNQDKTDTELAIELAEKLVPKEIIIIGGIGTRMDHTLANIYSITKIKKIKIKIIDHVQEIHIVDKKIEIIGKKKDTISILPLTNLKKMTYTGLKWIVKNKDVPFNWIGISNVLSGKKATVSIKKGKAVVIKTKKVFK